MISSRIETSYLGKLILKRLKGLQPLTIHGTEREISLRRGKLSALSDSFRVVTY